jgi:ABC-type Zn uptake system ZnuABC Zn-binding protein ZnuA
MLLNSNIGAPSMVRQGLVRSAGRNEHALNTAKRCCILFETSRLEISKVSIPVRAAQHGLVALLVAGVLISSAGLASCGQPGRPSTKVVVVTTNSIVADWVAKIGGDRVDVFSLLAAGADPHTFQPGAADVARVARAQLVFAVGLGLEREWLSRLLTNAATGPDRLVALGDYVQAMPADPAGPPDGPLDPHFWWDPVRVQMSIAEIARRLIQADSAGAETFRSNALAYAGELDQLDLRIADLTAKIPAAHRKIVTSHETMQYFARRYGLEVAGSIFPGIGTEKEPSPAELGQLATIMRQLGIGVIFTETAVNDRLARSVASETGAKIVRLYSDSLGPPRSGADSYLGMMNTNMEAIFQALE